jgi:PD-(D/E)XK nuclease superfamily
MRSAKPDEIENFIREAFENNSERMRFESGHALAPETKKAALDQVLLYWRRLRDVAEKITETEVRLHLPNQTTPKGRRFNIEGAVDIVQEGERTIMYDLKTHDADFVRANLSMYEEQLNVYAYIWQELRGLRLDETAILATRFPKSVKEALNSRDPVRLEKALEEWEPVIPVRMDTTRVKKAISEFGKVVDSIEERKFKAPRPSILQKNESLKGRFAVTVCGNCDARFSCDSFRAYSVSTKETQKRDRTHRDIPFKDSENQEEREERVDAAFAG